MTTKVHRLWLDFGQRYLRDGINGNKEYSGEGGDQDQYVWGADKRSFGARRNWKIKLIVYCYSPNKLTLLDELIEKTSEPMIDEEEPSGVVQE